MAMYDRLSQHESLDAGYGRQRHIVGQNAARSNAAAHREPDTRRPAPHSLLAAAGIVTASGPSSAGYRTPAVSPRRDLPLVELPDTSEVDAVYCAVSPVDVHGRFADRTPLKVLGWGPETAITIGVDRSAGIVVVRRGGPDAVTKQGHLRLPVRARRAGRIPDGARLLLMARPADQTLVIYTPRALDAMASAYEESNGSGERA
jgi:hypothetical protein